MKIINFILQVFYTLFMATLVYIAWFTFEVLYFIVLLFNKFLQWIK